MKKNQNSYGTRVSKFALSLMAFSMILVSCDKEDDEPTLQANSGTVSVQFKTAMADVGGRMSVPPINSSGDIMIQGTNGTLHIEAVHFIVDDFEVESEISDEDDNEFEGNSYFVDLPMNGNPLVIATAEIPEGTYSKFEFEIDDLDLDDEEDDAEQQEKAALMAAIHNDFPDWPESASMIIIGNFVDSDGIETPFTTYAEAEVSIEQELTPPMMIGTDAPDYVLSVNINPEAWFAGDDGTVMNLADYDYALTGELLDFEVEIENGFTEIEVDED